MRIKIGMFVFAFVVGFLGLGAANPAEATEAIPVSGAIHPGTFIEACSIQPQCVGPNRECCGPSEACVVYMEFDLNLSDDPVPFCETIPFASFTSRGRGATQWEGDGEWHVEDDDFQCGVKDDCFYTHSDGVWGRNSSVGGDPAVGNVEITYFIVGGSGRFENATGTLHARLFQQGTDSAEGSVHGVVRVP